MRQNIWNHCFQTNNIDNEQQICDCWEKKNERDENHWVSILAFCSSSTSLLDPDWVQQSHWAEGKVIKTWRGWRNWNLWGKISQSRNQSKKNSRNLQRNPVIASYHRQLANKDNLIEFRSIMNLGRKIKKK